MSLPGLAPIVVLVVLLEVPAGTVAVVFAGDLARDLGRGFVGTTAAICLAVLGLALLVAAVLPDPSELLHHRVDPAAYASLVHWTVGFAVALAAYVLFCVVGTDAARRVVGGATAALGTVAVIRAAGAFGGALGDGVGAAVAFLPAALLTGSVLAGMLLGHWYLIAPDLSFRPLRRAVGVVFVAVGVQAAVIAVAVATAGQAARGDLLGSRYGLSFWLLVVLAGLVSTVAVNALTMYFARIRANQPATAMLYVLIITVLMGVVPGHLLYFLTRVPV